jgi:hypothetical protein
MKIAVLDINGIQSELQGKKQHYFLVDNDYNFSGNSATDVTTLENIDLFYRLLRLDYYTYREHLKEFSNNNTFNSLDVETKKLLARNFVVGKSDRDLVYSDSEQEDFALDFQEKLTEAEVKLDFNNNVTDIINKEPDEITIVGELPNYRELDEEIDPEYVGVWHSVTLPNSIAPNSIIMVSCRSDKNNKFGGVREVGSSIDRRKKVDTDTSFSLLVKVNNENKIQVYGQTSDIHFYINAQIS